MPPLRFRRVIVHNHRVAPRKLVQSEYEKLGKQPRTFSPSSISPRIWKSGEKSGYAWNGMRTYGSGINPTDLCLEFREAHEQNHVKFPLVAPCIVCCVRSARYVGLDIAQRRKLVCWVLSAFREVTRKLEQPTWLFVFPVGRGQDPCVFGDSRSGLLRWAALGRSGEAMSDLSLLGDLGALQKQNSTLERQIKLVHDEP